MTDLGLILTYVLILAAIIACLISPILPIYHHLMNGETNQALKKVKTILIPILLIGGVFGIAAIIASSEVLPHYINSQGVLISSGTSKIIGGSLITFYILSLIAFGAILYSEFISKFFKNGKK